MIIEFEKLYTDSILPKKATPDSVGWDVHSTDDVIIGPQSLAKVSIGLKIKSIPSNVEIQIRSRSGLSINHFICVINSPATIDPDYTGEIFVGLVNHHPKNSFSVKKGDRIAQMVFAEILKVNVLGSGTTILSERNSGGFGSSGV